jgi:PAS domain S-box-containing protein
MRKLKQILSAAQAQVNSPEDSTPQRFRERVSELEAENASLRQLDATISRNTRLVQALLNRRHDGILLITPQLTFLRVVHSVLGNADQSLAGSSVLLSIHPEDRTGVCAAFSSLLREAGQTVVCECRVGDKNGQWCWMEVEMTDMLDDPDVQAIVFNSRNITLRKQYEAALKELETHRPCCGEGQCGGKKAG